MLHLTICDDESIQLSLLETYVREWAQDRRYETEVILCQNAEQFLFQWEEKREVDILLLDIDMPGMSGFLPAWTGPGNGAEGRIPSFYWRLRGKILLPGV